MDDLESMQAAVVAGRVAELEQKIAQADHDYHVLHLPKVPDEVYDAWKDELAQLKADSVLVTRVGAPLPQTSEWAKVEHSIPMGSLDKINTPDELTDWLFKTGYKGDPIFVTEKLDGISLHVKYENGAFSQAITRGEDGLIGQDISVNVAKMQGIPGKLPKRFTGSVRGEVVLTKTNFQAHFPTYENTRQAAGGTATRYDGRGCEHLTVFFYHVAEGKEFVGEDEQFVWLQEMGFKIPNWYVTAVAPGIKTPHDLWVEYQQTKRAELDYDIDGLVVRINNLANQISLGENHGRPKGAVAFKFAAMTRETTCRSIENETGAMGIITPVVIFDPIRLVGATVTRASAYNWKYIRDLGLDIGAKILVARANDVIPRVTQVTSSTGTVAEPPKACPSCDAPTEWDGEFIICSNSSGCPAQAAGRLLRYVQTLGIKEWGDTLIQRLVETGTAKTVPDLYRLGEAHLGEIERMGPKSAQKAIKTLWARNPIVLEELLGSLSIPKCQVSMVKLAVDAGYDTFETLRAATSEQLQAIDGFGPVKAKCLAAWMRVHGAMVDDLLKLGVKIKPRIKGGLTGKSFCFTGTLSQSREELAELAKKAGAEVKKDVTKKLDFLVIADPKSTTNKAVAARANGTKCLSEEQFLKMVGA